MQGLIFKYSNELITHTLISCMTINSIKISFEFITNGLQFKRWKLLNVFHSILKLKAIFWCETNQKKYLFINYTKIQLKPFIENLFIQK